MAKGRGREAIKRLTALFFNPRFLLCFGLAWLVTNGWAYAVAALGAVLESGWMLAVSGAYLTFLWFPFTPEKVLTLTLAILLLRWLFPKDEKTLGSLRQMYASLKKKNKDAV